MSDIDERAIFAENLREILKEKGISQQTLARFVGVSDASVSFWLNGQKYPSPGKVQKIADYLGVRKSQLIDKNPPISYKVETILSKLERLTPAQLHVVESLIDEFLNI